MRWIVGVGMNWFKLLSMGVCCAASLFMLLVPAAEGRWAFNPVKDEFSAEAMFDLRELNEKVAGESGYVTRSKDGNDFVSGNGQPVRFWAVGDGAAGSRKNVDLARHA